MHPRIGRAFDALLVLPPDFQAPGENRRHRFPPQGPALVAASVAPDGVRLRVADLELSAFRNPPAGDAARLDDDEALFGHLRGRADAALDALATDQLGRMDLTGCAAVAFSFERHTQIRLGLLLAAEVKRRTGLPVLVGGVSALTALDLLQTNDIAGIDLVTRAKSPAEIRLAFQALRELPRGRRERAQDPVPQDLPVPPDEWPVPDFGIFDLDAYARDPFAALGHHLLPRYDGSAGARLVLPYSFTFGCQFACRFCQVNGEQQAKSPGRVVRDLARLAELHGTRDFMLFDTQINVHAEPFARALAEAGLGLRWSDSYRVLPSPPGRLELLARSGCVGLTIGVESGSDRVLKRMVKGHSAAHATRVVREAHANEIFLRVNLLPCFPGETREDFEQTRAWLADNGFAIDDLAPSSFYLFEDSPVFAAPERHGIRIRGLRTEAGDYRFRKMQGSHEYDEVAGLRWEERAATLRPAEDELRRTWCQARGELGRRLPSMQTAFMNALRAAFPTKPDAYAALLRWFGDGGAPACAAPPQAPAPAGDASPPQPGPLRLTSPHDCTPAALARFESFVAQARPQLEPHLGRPLAAHAFVFDDGDFICFEGTVAAGAGDVSVVIENMLGWRLDSKSPRRQLYGQLSPGARVLVQADAVVVEGQRPVALTHRTHFHLFSFAGGRL